MKKVMSLFLSLTTAFLIITASVPVAFAAEYNGKCGSNVFWTLDTFTGELVISGSGSMSDYSADSAPSWSTYQSYIKSVTVSDGVTSVGAYSFYNITGYKYQKMTDVSLSSSVELIGDYAFRGCKSLTAVIGTGVEQIGEYAFRSCESLSALNLISVVSVGNGAFSYCTGITALPIPASVTTIGSSAFKGCSGITSLTLPDNITSLGNQAFADCTGLTAVEFSASEITQRVYGVFNGSGADGGMNVTFGDNVTAVVEGLFENCSNINEVTFGSAVTSVGDFSFYGSGVKSVVIPASVKTIGSYAFSLCNSLVSFSVDSSNTAFSAGSNGELMNKAKTYIYRYPSGRTESSYTLPTTVRIIAVGAFSGDDDLVTVDTSYTVTINDYAFTMCQSLSSVTLTLVSTLKPYAFADCNSLSAVSAPKLKTVGEYTFFGCDELTDLSGFTAMTEISSYAFSNIQGIKTLTIPSTVTAIGDYAFNNCDNLATLTVPSNVKNIHTGAFANCDNLNSVILEEGITTVYQYAFLNCPALLSVKIPASVTQIGTAAFGYKQSGTAYSAISGFKIYCYSGTAGYTYAQNHSSRLSYEVVTDGIEEDSASPEIPSRQPVENIDIFNLVFSLISKLLELIMNLI
ncbi:MAG: leucine-rich repeat domain-containing protein [Clostridia bacterium]|nr:leucine-rich repeat domain-containing protein [Clostridia bacterium]